MVRPLSESPLPDFLVPPLSNLARRFSFACSWPPPALRILALVELLAFRLFANSSPACQSRRFPYFPGLQFRVASSPPSLAPRSSCLTGSPAPRIPDSGLPGFPAFEFGALPTFRLPPVAACCANSVVYFPDWPLSALCEFCPLLPAGAVRRLADPQRSTGDRAKSLRRIPFYYCAGALLDFPFACLRFRAPSPLLCLAPRPACLIGSADFRIAASGLPGCSAFEFGASLLFCLLPAAARFAPACRIVGLPRPCEFGRRLPISSISLSPVFDSASLPLFFPLRLVPPA